MVILREEQDLTIYCQKKNNRHSIAVYSERLTDLEVNYLSLVDIVGKRKEESHT